MKLHEIITYNMGNHPFTMTFLPYLIPAHVTWHPFRLTLNAACNAEFAARPGSGQLCRERQGESTSVASGH